MLPLRNLADQKLGRLLEAAYLAQGDGARAKTTRLLDAARDSTRKKRRDLGDGLARRMACVLARGLLGAHHAEGNLGAEFRRGI